MNGCQDEIVDSSRDLLVKNHIRRGSVFLE